MIPNRHGGTLTGRHIPKHCPYCREGRECPMVTAQQWRERANRVYRIADEDVTPVPSDWGTGLDTWEW